MRSQGPKLGSTIEADELRLPKGIAEYITLLDRQKQVTKLYGGLAKKKTHQSLNSLYIQTYNFKGFIF